MTLRGTREEWEALSGPNDEGGVGLKVGHVRCIRFALDQASPDARVIEVDAMLAGVKQVRERASGAKDQRTMARKVADDDESWWIHRARELGLTSIEPVAAWPREPDIFMRPIGYFHDYGGPEALRRWKEAMGWDDITGEPRSRGS